MVVNPFRPIRTDCTSLSNGGAEFTQYFSEPGSPNPRAIDVDADAFIASTAASGGVVTGAATEQAPAPAPPPPPAEETAPQEAEQLVKEAGAAAVQADCICIVYPGVCVKEGGGGGAS